MSLAPAPDDGMGKLIVDAIRAALQVRAGRVLTPELIEERARNGACWVMEAVLEHREAKALAKRFWSKVDRRGADDCWAWKAHLMRIGYGQIGTRRGGKRRMEYAHRLSWELANGPVPAGLFVCHRCDNRACVNPGHLFLGTPADNVADMMAKGRGRGEPHRGEANGGSKLTEAKVREIRDLLASGHQKTAIADRFGVTRTAIHWIATRRAWKHVDALFSDDDKTPTTEGG